MSDFIETIGSSAFRLLGRLLAWHLRNWQAAWTSEWNKPYVGLRLIYLSISLCITCVLVPTVFNDLGVLSGLSYCFAVYLAISNATFFRVVRINRNRHLPLGIVAPVFIVAGMIGSSAVRPLIGDARNAVIAQDFVGAIVIIGVFAIMTIWFRLWQSGNPY